MFMHVSVLCSIFVWLFNVCVCVCVCVRVHVRVCVCVYRITRVKLNFALAKLKI